MARKLDTHTAHSPAPLEPQLEPQLVLPYENPVLTALVRIVAEFTAAPLHEQFAARAGIPANSKAVTALFTLASSGPMRPSTLADLLDTSLAGASRVLDSLADAGLAVRSPDPGDARATIVTLTPAGTDAARELFHQGDLMMSELLADWSADDSATLGRLLTRFAAAVAATKTPATAQATAPE